MNPFEDWNEHDPENCVACGEFGVVEPFDLANRQAALARLVPEPGDWPNAATLLKFGPEAKMNGDQLSRFVKKIEPTQIDWHTPCWLWKAGTHDKGYGRFFLGALNGQRIHGYSHRVSFEHFIGSPPAGYIVDHQCNHKLCCNPTHLWPETNNNNLRLADQRRPWQRRNQFSKE